MKNEIKNYEILQNQLQIGSWEKLSGFNEDTISKNIAVFGIGGSGSPMVVTLTRMGFKKIFLVDKDIVEEKNLTRQILYSVKDVGKTKTESALSQLVDNHSFQSSFETYQMDINKNLDKSEEIIKRSDFVFNLVDDDVALYNISLLCRKHKKASIYFGTGIIAGMTSAILYQSAEEGCCIACMKGLPLGLDKIKENNKKGKLGVTPSWYPTPALGAAFSSVLLIKSLLGQKIDFNYISTSLYAIQVTKLNMDKNPDCKICSNNM